MNKQHILNEIKRTAAANNGIPLGEKKFFQETGIKRSDWFGKHWAKWGDAIKEAGLVPNQMQTAYEDGWLIEKVISLIRELGRFPSHGDLRLKAHMDSNFPSHNTFSRFGAKSQFVIKVLDYCQTKDGYQDVVAVCTPFIAQGEEVVKTGKESEKLDDNEIGFVYLLQAGRYYKIGKTNAIGRREREVSLQLPEKIVTVHSIRTDDPSGIEAYWHKRFAAKRKNGEWFELNSSDVMAFKRRKFM